ncbi:mechanosensitive ion channel domain-containing protein [Chroococcus sp. FPU101]|uniref:mechanosensitive ion channel domain-containing protein n=1 Tax=Chroococcus sp. FPU101 TaxID=1974212 RepID=UPI001A8BF54A
MIVGKTEGNVEQIDLRATQLLTHDGRVVLVPNAKVVFSYIITELPKIIDVMDAAAGLSKENSAKSKLLYQETGMEVLQL